MGQFKELSIQKQDLVKILLDDFVKMYPESTHWERVHLSARLHFFGIDDLNLLVSQLGKVSNE